MAIWTATRIAAPSVMRRDATVSTRLMVSTPPTSGSVTCSTLTRDLLRASAPIYPSMTAGALEVTPGPRTQVHRRLRPAKIEDLVAVYQAGATACQLADRFRIHRTTVLSLLERQSVARRNRSLSFAQVVQARELYAARQSRAKVGKQLGCHASTGRLAPLHAGVRMRAGGSSGCKDVDPVGSCSGGEEPGVSWRKV